MNRHAIVTIEEVENGLLVRIADDNTRNITLGPGNLNEFFEALRPRIQVASTVEEACLLVTNYFNQRENGGSHG